MRKLIDLTGQRFGRLTVIGRSSTGKCHNVYWDCQCSCGKKVTVRGDHLREGTIKSCGCLVLEISSEKATTHGKSHSRLYNTWLFMRRRCGNCNDQAYPRYGGRGIEVCDEWKANFQSFYDWAISNGYRPELSIDRIDNDKGYSPENCRWATSSEQARNRRSNHLITFAGETHSMIEWAEIVDIPLNVLCLRIVRYGWPIWRALTEPLHKRNRKTK